MSPSPTVSPSPLVRVVFCTSDAVILLFHSTWGAFPTSPVMAPASSALPVGADADDEEEESLLPQPARPTRSTGSRRSRRLRRRRDKGFTFDGIVKIGKWTGTKPGGHHIRPLASPPHLLWVAVRSRFGTKPQQPRPGGRGSAPIRGGRIADDGLHTVDQPLDALVIGPERVLAQHGALAMVVQLQVHPVDGEVAAPLLCLSDELTANPRTRGLGRHRFGGEDLEVGGDPGDRSSTLEQ